MSPFSRSRTVSSPMPRPGLAIRARLALLACIAVVALMATSSPGLAQAPVAPSPTPTSAPSGPDLSPEEAPENPREDRGPTDGREVEAFLDGFFARQLEGHKIPGATVSVVKDGEVLFAKGYGEADVEAGRPVVADETLFRIASTSKLFTATAAMQLVEEGRLDLDEDVNAYLADVEVPDTYPGRPVTLRHLLTHTAGFEQTITGSGARDAADVEPLGEYLSNNVPGRVRPPGEAKSYSNYGMSLAGLVVEEASGMPFARYVEENVTAPLGMDSTTFDQPPAPELGERVATGYDVVGGDPVAGPFEYIDEAPAGGVSTTATDMARFMIAQLQDGRYGDARILDEATAKEMHAKQFAGDPRLDGMGLGFYEQTVNGERVIEHGGNLFRFHAVAALVPERNVGIFVAYNSYGEGGEFAEYELLRAFFDRYYPETPPAPEPPAEGSSGNAELVAGAYRSTRSNETGFEKVFSLLGPTSVTANEDGSITTSGVPTQEDLTGGEQRWTEDGPMTFRAEGSDEHLAFRQDGEGRVTYLSGDADPTSAFEKLPFYGSAGLHLGLVAGGLAVFLITTLAWPAGALISRRYERRYRKLHGEPGGKFERDARGARPARLLGWALCALALVFVGGMALLASNGAEALFFDSPLLAAVLALPYLVAALAVVVVVYAALSWKRRYWGLFGRAYYSLVAVAALTFVTLLGYYNLLGL